MLNDDDITLLMEGLEAIDRAAGMSDSMEMLVGGMLGGLAKEKDPSFVEKMEADQNARKKKVAAERRRKQEDVYLLRAKLVQMRRDLDSQSAERILADAAK